MYLSVHIYSLSIFYSATTGCEPAKGQGKTLNSVATMFVPDLHYEAEQIAKTLKPALSYTIEAIFRPPFYIATREIVSSKLLFLFYVCTYYIM